jgi:methionyl-tRNA synthetase
MSSGETYFVTSALPYVNNVPHLGNIIGCVLSADIFARYLRKIGKKVLYLCGTDEYGTTTEVKAKSEGVSCKEICDKYHILHKQIYDWFNISFDVFGRTTTDTHTKIAQEIFIALWKNDCLEPKEVEQFRCIKCDMFLADRYLKVKCYHSGCGGIANGDQCDSCQNILDTSLITECWCSMCGEVPIKTVSKHLYLRMSDYEKPIKEKILDNSSVFLSDNARNITRAWLTTGLESRCITRDLKWGTPVPDLAGLEDYKGKVFYVWFDAPIGYLSILAHAKPDWLDWLKGRWVQFMAKDNVPFHTLIFPATIMGSKLDYPIVTDLSCTEYLNYEGKKFSKSNGVGVFGDHAKQLSEILNIDEDYWRYYLLKIRPQVSDSTFNWEEFAAVIKGELAQKMGNYINRCISMSNKYYSESGTLKFDFRHGSDIDVYKTIVDTFDDFTTTIEKYKYPETIRAMNKIAEIGNLYINNNKVWEACRTDPVGNEHIMGNLLYIAWCLAELMDPIMPKKTERIKSFITYDTDRIGLYTVDNGVMNYKTSGYSNLFNQITTEQIENAKTVVGIV